MKNFDAKNKSISSPKMDELRIKYCKRSTEKANKELLPIISSETAKIISQKSQTLKARIRENSVNEAIIHNINGNYEPKMRQNSKLVDKPKLRFEKQQSDISTGAGTSKSPSSAPFA